MRTDMNLCCPHPNSAHANKARNPFHFKNCLIHGKHICVETQAQASVNQIDHDLKSHCMYRIRVSNRDRMRASLKSQLLKITSFQPNNYMRTVTPRDEPPCTACVWHASQGVVRIMKLELEPRFPIAYSSSLYGRKITFTAPSALKVMSGDHLGACCQLSRVESILLFQVLECLVLRT